jgi:hypothetical protein
MEILQHVIQRAIDVINSIRLPSEEPPAVAAVGSLHVTIEGVSVRLLYPASTPQGFPVKTPWVSWEKGMKLTATYLKKDALGPFTIFVDLLFITLVIFSSWIPDIFFPALPNTYPRTEPLGYKHAKFPLVMWLPGERGFGEENALLLAELVRRVPCIVCIVQARADRELTAAREQRLSQTLRNLQISHSTGLLSRVLRQVDFNIVAVGGSGLGGSSVMNFLSTKPVEVLCAFFVDGTDFIGQAENGQIPCLFILSEETSWDDQAVKYCEQASNGRVVLARNTMKGDLMEFAFWRPDLNVLVWLDQVLGYSHRRQENSRKSYLHVVKTLADFVRSYVITNPSSCDEFESTK